MLKELFEQHRNIPRSETLRFPEYVDQSTRTFDALVDLLRDSQRFPNREVNDLVTLEWRLIGNKVTPVALDQWGIKSLSFVALGNGSERTGLFIMPTNYIDLVREDPAMQIGAVAFSASQARDFYTGRIESDGSKVVDKRARAFEAETLLTLDQLAQSEEVALEWNSYQRSVLEEFPKGLEDLPEALRYPTPPFVR